MDVNASRLFVFSPVRRLVLHLAALTWLFGAVADTRAALTTESPEVKQSVARAIAFLEQASDNRQGALALQGLSLVKSGADLKHPLITATAETIAKAAGDDTLDQDIYSLGLSIIYLTSLDPDEYRTEIESLLKTLAGAQKDHGGWGYHYFDTGDTSMTQYAVLAMWEAEQVGIRPPIASWERVANWLLRTQDPSGAFGYQGTDPGNFNLVQQDEVRHSMAAAGTGSLYICADRLGMVQLKTDTQGVPAALKPVSDGGANAPSARTRNVDAARMAAARELGDRWLLTNYTIEPEQWVYYYLYAFERYQSFREAAETRTTAGGPAWYDDGARFLIANQKEDGSWVGQAGDVPDTAFAVLFLLRSTRKSIQRAKTYGAGTLVGGRGVPTGTAELLLKKGKIVPRPLEGPAEEVFAIMADPGHQDFLRAIESLEAFTEGDDVDSLAAQADRLVQLAEQGSPEARAAAVKALARTRNLDHVPALIEALEDPDQMVFLEARDGLRFISRKLRGFGLTAQSSDADVKAAVEKWRAWFRAVRPHSPIID